MCVCIVTFFRFNLNNINPCKCRIILNKKMTQSEKKHTQSETQAYTIVDEGSPQEKAPQYWGATEWSWCSMQQIRKYSLAQKLHSEGLFGW